MKVRTTIIEFAKDEQHSAHAPLVIRQLSGSQSFAKVVETSIPHRNQREALDLPYSSEELAPSPFKHAIDALPLL